MARLILEVMKLDPERRSAINLRYQPTLIELIKKLGLKISSYNRLEEPEDQRKIEGGSINWGVTQAINKIGEVPDVIYHTGDWGKEPIIALIGCDAVDVAKMAICLAQLYSIRKPEVLFAPTRSLYSDKKLTTSCIFCGISKGEPEIEEMILYKDDDNMVLMNIYPYNRGHLEVVPRKHYTDLNELKPDELKNFFLLVQKTITLIREVIKPDGINLGFNLGKAAGSSVEHLHLHLVPRFKFEGGFMETVASTRVISENLDETYKRYMKEIQLLR
jgi:diadenosine tetraphosphate (Ap4A) HIT family hydrolase